jgi:MFS family permease
MFMSVLDTSIVNVAIPTIQNEFGGTTDDVEWVVTGYTLTLGVVVPITAWLADRVGLKQLYNLALLAFAGGSALCGISGNLNSLVIFRAGQRRTTDADAASDQLKRLGNCLTMPSESVSAIARKWSR